MAAAAADDPALAYQHAQVARRLGARVGVVRETCGIAAYQAGEWADGLAELRAARRLTGEMGYLPIMADCERALGRPERALDLIAGVRAGDVDRSTALELRIVESGIRRDQGLPEAAIAVLEVPELTSRRPGPQAARLYYAYADALLDAGRELQARDWFAAAAAADADGMTDAGERLDQLDPVVFDDLEEDDLEEPVTTDADASE